MRKWVVTIFDWLAVVLSFLIFMTAWFNGNLTDMPWYGLLVVLLLAIFSVLAVFAVLTVRGHRRVSIGFAIVLLLLGVPSMMHVSSGDMSFIEMVLFYVKQVYIPLLAIGSLFLLLKRQQLWRRVLRWSARAYAALGVAVGLVLLYRNITQLPLSLPDDITSTADMPIPVDTLATMLMIVTIVGFVLTIFGLIVSPLYIAWRTTRQDSHQQDK